MQKKLPQDLKRHIILEFTRELIKSTKTYNDILTKNEVKLILYEKPEKPPKKIIEAQNLKEKNVHEIIKNKIERDSQKVNQLKKEVENPFAEFIQSKRKALPQRLIIPDPMLPPTVSYIKPIPMQREIDLGKINPLIEDPLVNSIECVGSQEKIIVNGKMGRKNTPIILNSQEIKELIVKFSKTAKIPIHGGVNKIVFGRLMLQTIFSEFTDSKFILHKMPLTPPNYMYKQQ